MSGIYFQSPHGAEQVSGAERALMGQLVLHTGKALLVDALDRLNPEVHLNPDHPRVRAGRRDQPTKEWLDSILGWSLFTGEAPALLHGGVPVAHSDVIANTAMLIGSDVLRLAARIDSQCELHCFVEGADRAWLAARIVEGCDTGVLRRGFSQRHGREGGWDAVVDLLRSRADEPVVLSYSVCDGFPNAECSTWVAPNAGREWDTEEQEYQALEEDEAAWDALPEAEQWRMGMEWLRASPGMLRLDPSHWADYRFGNCLTAFDFSPKYRAEVPQ